MSLIHVTIQSLTKVSVERFQRSCADKKTNKQKQKKNQKQKKPNINNKKNNTRTDGLTD